MLHCFIYYWTGVLNQWTNPNPESLIYTSLVDKDAHHNAKGSTIMLAYKRKICGLARQILHDLIQPGKG